MLGNMFLHDAAFLKRLNLSEGKAFLKRFPSTLKSSSVYQGRDRRLHRMLVSKESEVGAILTNKTKTLSPGFCVLLGHAFVIRISVSPQVIQFSLR